MQKGVGQKISARQVKSSAGNRNRDVMQIFASPCVTKLISVPG
jgi:hypothetical protein